MKNRNAVHCSRLKFIFIEFSSKFQIHNYSFSAHIMFLVWKIFTTNQTFYRDPQFVNLCVTADKYGFFFSYSSDETYRYPTIFSRDNYGNYPVQTKRNSTCYKKAPGFGKKYLTELLREMSVFFPRRFFRV